MDRRSRSVPCVLSINQRILGLCWAEKLTLADVLLAGAPVLEVGSKLELTVHAPVGPSALLRATVTHRGDASCRAAFDPGDWLARDQLRNVLEHLRRQSREHTDPALVVTRNAGLARSLANELAAAGVTPFLVASPVEAMWRLAGTAVGTVLLDVEAVGDNLRAWLELLRAQHPHLTRALVSSEPSVEIAAALRSASIDALLTVPWRPDYLRQVVTRCREMRQPRLDDRACRGGGPAVLVSA